MDFDDLVDRYQKPIYNLVFRLIGDLDEASDVTQETFVAAYKAFGGFRGEASIYTWLCRIALNRCKNKFRETERRKKAETAITDLEELADAAGGFASAKHEAPQAIVERRELREHIERAIRDLPYDYRIVAVLRDLQGLSYQEIAEVTGLSLDMVRTRLSRARDTIRRRLLPYIEQ